MAEIYANNAKGRLAAPITVADATIALAPGHTFPDPGANWYRATLYRWEHSPEGIREFDHEVVRVTGLTGDTLTVERALEGGPFAYDPETRIELRMTAGTAGSIETRAQAAADTAETQAKAYTDTHAGHTDNPHNVTKAQVGLGNVDNVSAANLRARSSHTGTQPLSTISDAGTAASRDVGEGAGQVMEVGAFGLGGSAVNSANPFAFTESGFASSPLDSNNPTPFGRYQQVVVKDHAQDAAIRITARSSGRLYERHAFWEATGLIASGGPPESTGWRMFYDSANILGTVSQSDGTPTGAIIEEDSNSFGSWTKFAGGRMISETVLPDIPRASPNGFFVASLFPQPFVAPPFQSFSMRSFPEDFVGYSRDSVGSPRYDDSLTAWRCTILKNSAGEDVPAGAYISNVRALAVGRWHD